MRRFRILLALMALMALTAGAENKNYIIRVLDYSPAPGQFINTTPQYVEGEPLDSLLARVLWNITGRYIYETYDRERFTLDPDCLMTCIREGGAKVPTGKTRGDKTYKRSSQSNILIDGELDFTVNGSHIPVAPFRELMHQQGSGLDFGAQLKLAEEHGFELLVKRAKINMSKHVRVRPLFRNWQITCTLTVLDEEGSGLTKDVLEKIFQQAGTYCGLGDWRPSSPKSPGTFGTFTATLEAIG